MGSRERLALGASLAKTAVLYAHTKAVSVPDYIGIITDELLLNPWDREVFRDGEFHFHPEYAEALKHQGLETIQEMLIPANFFGLQRNKATQHSVLRNRITVIFGVRFIFPIT